MSHAVNDLVSSLPFTNEIILMKLSSASIAVVYSSVHHGNTRLLANTLAQSLNATLLSAEDASQVPPSDFDVWGLGSGIYFGRHHRHLLDLVDGWNTGPKACFIFSTAGLPFLKRWQHAALRRRLLARQVPIVAEFCCRGWDTVGPLWLMGGLNRKHPNQSDLAQATEFCVSLRRAAVEL